MSVSLIPLSRFVPIRDEAHALVLLRDAGVRETDDELRRLTQQLLEGRLLLVREELPPELDELVELTRTTPSLSDLVDSDPLTGGDPITHEPALPKTWFALRLVTHEGCPIGDVDLELVFPNGSQTVVRTDVDGCTQVDGIDGRGAVSVRPTAPIQRPPQTGSPCPVPAGAVVIAADGLETLQCQVEQQHVLALEPPGVHTVELEDLNFAWNRYVLLPDFGDMDNATGLPVTARAVLRTVLRFSETHPGRELLVAGHTDTDGSASNNLKVSQRRAHNVKLYLEGNRQGWAAQAHAHHEVADWQEILAWAARVMGWDCDPGEIDNAYGRSSKEARERFRTTYNAVFPDSAPLSVQGSQRVADWAAFFDLYDHALARVMHIGTDDLAGLRAGLSFVGDGVLACGEHQPREAEAVDGFRSRTNRRVDILFFEPQHLPDLAAQPPGAGLYAAGYRVVSLPVPGVGTVVFRVVDEVGTAQGNVDVVLGCPHGGQITRRTDAAGCVPLDALAGDEFEVIEIRTSDSSKLVQVDQAT